MKKQSALVLAVFVRWFWRCAFILHRGWRREGSPAYAPG